MQSAIDSFLRHLRIEKNVAPLTLKSYAEDFESLAAYFQDRLGQVPDLTEITVGILRGYVSYLHECQYAKTTIARRLASLRTFFKYLLPRKPRAEQSGQGAPHAANRAKAAAFFDDRPGGPVAGNAAGQQADGPPRPGHSRDDLLGRPASRRSGRRQHRRLGPRRQRASRPRQGPQRAGRPAGQLRRPRSQPLDAGPQTTSTAIPHRCSSTSSANGSPPAAWAACC